MSQLPLEHNIPIQRYFPPLTSRSRFSPERLLVHPLHTLRRVYVIIEDPRHQYRSDTAATSHTATSSTRKAVSVSKPSPPVSTSSSTVSTEPSVVALPVIQPSTKKQRVSKSRQPTRLKNTEFTEVGALCSFLFV